jgi:hypothetical protein
MQYGDSGYARMTNVEAEAKAAFSRANPGSLYAVASGLDQLVICSHWRGSW